MTTPILQPLQQAPTQPFSELNQLQQDLQDQLEKQRLETIDEVVELLFEMYDLEKDPKKWSLAQKNIPMLKNLLSSQIKIQRLLIKPLTDKLGLDNDFSLDDIIDLIDQRTILLANAKKKGDTNREVKLTNDIESYNKIKEVMEELERLEKAKNGIQDPPADPRAVYPTLTPHKRLSLLSKLLQSNTLQLYSELLGTDADLENSESFQTVLKPFKFLIQGSKWERLSLDIFKTFLKSDVSQHYAMKIFLITGQSSDLISPFLMNQAYDAIKKMEVPEECLDRHSEFIDNFSRVTVEQLNNQVNEIVKDFEEFKYYGKTLADIMRGLQPSKQAQPAPILVEAPKIITESALSQKLIGFDVDFGQYKAFEMAKEVLQKKDILGSSQLIKSLMHEITGNHPLEQKFCAMYSMIIKELPDFQIALSDDQVFSRFAPNQLANTVSELFLQLKKKQKSQNEEEKGDFMIRLAQDEHLSRVILGNLEEIFYEDAGFNKMLCQYLSESGDYGQVITPYFSQIKSLKSLQQEHLEKALRQVESKGGGPQRIADFMAVDIDMDLQNLQNDIGKWYIDSKKLNGQTTTLLLYDLIKKRCTFDKFITLLSQNVMGGQLDMLFTQQFFLKYLLNNSDTYLRTMILMACSFFMPLPLVSYNPRYQMDLSMRLNNHRINPGSLKIMPVQLLDQDIEAKIEFVPCVYEELFYCFEKHMAVLTFKVSANPNKSPQGCTTLTNSVFNRTFQTHSRSMVNYGSIEIQFDNNFEHQMFVPVADAHGLVEEDILEQVYPMFNIFLIHSFIGPEHQQIAQRQISKIHKVSQKSLIFNIIHDESRKDNNLITKVQGNIVEISLGRFNDMLGIPKANLSNTIAKHFLKHIGNYKIYESDIPARLKSLQQFSDFANQFRAYKRQSLQMEGNQRPYGGFQEDMQLVEALQITRNFLKMIDKNKEQLRSDKVLTMNFLFEEACHLEKIMIRDTTLKGEVCEQHRLRVEELFKKMKISVLSPLTQELKKIIEHQNYIGLTSIISKFIKSILIFNLQPLLKEREVLRTSVQNADIMQEVKEEMYKKIGQITKTLEKRWYSNEFLYREYYISELSQFRDSEIIPAQAFPDYLALASMQISQGQPFEIIDGNNLQFIKEVYQRIQADRMQEEEILVVSVIGPQSSGKSLLLNTLFGAQFLSSAGRCTRGIYGCLIDIKCDIKQTHFKKILILDSEGIQSTEAVDEAFDKRVVFYILCVSHVVLICNKGEMNKNMEDTIKLATDCIMQVRENIDQQPQVNIIMNNVQINENSLYQTIQSLSNSIMEMRRHEKLRQIFTIDQSNVFLLPNAFAQSGNEEFVAYQPSYQFAQKVDQLRKRILTFMQCSVKGEIASYTLESWFKFAQEFWKFTDSYVGLTEYSTLEERKEDILLFEFTKKLIADNFEDPQKILKHERMIHDGVNKVLEQHQGFDQTNINVIKTKIDNALYPRIQEVEFKIQEEFRKFIDEKGIRPQIKKRRVQQLDTQIRQNFFNWQQLIQKQLGDFNQKKSKFIGEKYLQNVIDDYIKANHSKITVEDAGFLFEKHWLIIESDQKKQLKSGEQVSEEQFQDVGQLYRANTRSIINIDQERALIAQYQNLDSNVIFKKLSGQNAFFFFNSKAIRPQMEILKEQIKREKNFLSNKNQFFEEINVQELYNWKKLIQERFNFQQLQAILIDNASKITGDWYFGARKREGLTAKKVSAIIIDIREECQYFNVIITEYFETSLVNLEKNEIEKVINEQKNLQQKRRRDTMSQQDEINCVRGAIEDYIDNLKNNIEHYFKYKSEIIKHINLAHLRYFDCQNIRDLKNQYISKKETFQQFKYIEQWNPQDYRFNKAKGDYPDGLEPLIKKQSYFTIKTEIRQQDPYLTQYLEILIRTEKGHIASGSKPVERALLTFFSLIDHEKLLQNIQKIVLENIFRNSKDNKHTTVEELVRELIVSDDSNITQKFCAMDFKTIQRIVVSVEGIVVKINQDMEPYSLIVSETGCYCLHQIAQTYIIRIMQEVIRLTEHAPLLTFKKTKEIQRDLFIAKLTSNDKEMDIKLAEMTGRDLAQIIIKQVKEEQIQAFKDKIEGEQNLFKLKTIIKNIENQVLQIADGKLPNPFQYDDQKPAAKEDKIVKESKKLIGKKKKNDKEEEKKEEIKEEISKFKKMNSKLEFTPDEIIMYYVQPSEFLKKRFNDQWQKVTDIEIKIAKQSFANKIQQINLNFQKYFQYFQNQIQAKNIQLSTNVFIPERKDQLSQEIAQQAFKSYCQKAMAIYMGLVVTKNWKAGTAISVDKQVNMIVPETLSLVTHNDIRLELLQPYAGILQQSIQNQLISNIYNFIQSLMSEMTVGLNIDRKCTNFIDLQENELIGNLHQVMKTKTLGCDQMCPLCRRQCDQIHDGDVIADRVHRCEEGHQIQGFGGNRHKLSNKAITYGCHELIDQDKVVWNGKNLKWKKFQEVIFNEQRWDLEDKNQGAKQLQKEKNMKIWNLIGPFICQFYREESKIDISFIQADIDAKRIALVQTSFYVLMLDNSGSMSTEDSNGQSKWRNLTSAVSQFIINIEKDILLKNNSKVSIITYNSDAKLEIEAQEPSESIVAALKVPGGATDFNPPLNMAKDLMDKYYDSFDNFVLVMMSDGESSYPKNGVENIKKSPAKGKLKFKSIAYGGGSQSLTKMAKELGGTSEKILQPNQLSTAFIQMIPNLYTQ